MSDFKLLDKINPTHNWDHKRGLSSIIVSVFIAITCDEVWGCCISVFQKSDRLSLHRFNLFDSYVQKISEEFHTLTFCFLYFFILMFLLHFQKRHLIAWIYSWGDYASKHCHFFHSQFHKKLPNLADFAKYHQCKISVGPRHKIPKKPKLLYFGCIWP